MDPDWTFQLTQGAFRETAIRHGLIQSAEIKAAFRSLDADSKGWISITDLEWSEAAMLNRFYSDLATRYGSIRTAACACLGMDNACHLRLTRQNFVRRLVNAALADDSDSHKLFDMLCNSKHVARPLVTYDELLWLEAMNIRTLRPSALRVTPGATNTLGDPVTDGSMVTSTILSPSIFSGGTNFHYSTSSFHERGPYGTKQSPKTLAESLHDNESISTKCPSAAVSDTDGSQFLRLFQDR